MFYLRFISKSLVFALSAYISLFPMVNTISKYNFEDCPIELQRTIFRYLDLQSLNTACCVSQNCNDIIQSFIFERYPTYFQLRKDIIQHDRDGIYGELPYLILSSGDHNQKVVLPDSYMQRWNCQQNILEYFAELNRFYAELINPLCCPLTSNQARDVFNILKNIQHSIKYEYKESQDPIDDILRKLKAMDKSYYRSSKLAAIEFVRKYLELHPLMVVGVCEQLYLKKYEAIDKNKPLKCEELEEIMNAITKGFAQFEIKINQENLCISLITRKKNCTINTQNENNTFTITYSDIFLSLKNLLSNE